MIRKKVLYNYAPEYIFAKGEKEKWDREIEEDILSTKESLKNGEFDINFIIKCNAEDAQQLLFHQRKLEEAEKTIVLASKKIYDLKRENHRLNSLNNKLQKKPFVPTNYLLPKKKLEEFDFTKNSY